MRAGPNTVAWREDELMEHAEQWTAERGLPLLTLNMFAGNARARRFYEKGGFQIEMVKYAKRVTLAVGR